MAIQLPDGFRFRRYEVVDSTNSKALEAARDGEENGLWIVARHQTAGRGSRGRTWIGQDGNLFSSLLLVEPAEVGILGELTFVFALAVRDTLFELFLERGLQAAIFLKWPNDVLVDGEKISGILLESHEIARRRILIAGIGINCAGHPENVTWPATDLRASGVEITSDALFVRLSGHVARRLMIWDRGKGFAGIRSEWLASAVGVGEAIRAQLPGGTFEGIFEDIDDAGKLLLRTENGSRVALSSADIFFRDSQHAGIGA
jgi:BirA family transcriptional regulator, biotin operon repressor / biotin---[acetyl-CoA-carboxylase] ligase